MKKNFKYLSYFCCIIFFMVILFAVLCLNYDDDRLSASNFSENDIVISTNVSEKNSLIEMFKNYIYDKYNLPLYLQWVMIEITNSGGNITEEFMGCSFNTYKEVSNEYGHIVVNIDLIDMNSYSFNATFGDEKKMTSLKDKELIWDNLEYIDIILDAADVKMKQISKDKNKFKYTLEFNKKIILHSNVDNLDYIYDSNNNIFIKSDD